MLIDDPINIIGFCESFLADNVCDYELQVNGYKHERNDRSFRHGGGLIVYIKDSVQYRRRLDLESMNLESIVIDVCLNVNRLLLTLYTDHLVPCKIG